jgi:hypothetical protein
MDAPAHGLRVSVIGFPETDTFMLSLDNAVWSPADGEALPEREPIESSMYCVKYVLRQGGNVKNPFLKRS